MPYRAAILSAIEGLRDHETGSPSSSIRHYIKEHDTIFATAVASSDDDTKWNETLFLSTLKSLVSSGTLVHINGTNYKFSDKYLTKRADKLRARAESIEEHQHANMTNHPPREEPPKELPKKKTVHSKVKINEGKVITVVGGKVHGKDEMETDDDEDDMDNNGKERKSKHVKIIPRKVGAKKM